MESNSQEFIYTPQAEKEFKEDESYLHDRDPSAAESFYEQGKEALLEIRDNPKLGAKPYFEKRGYMRYRMLSKYKSYAFFYIISDTKITVFRFVRLDRDLAKVFGYQYKKIGTTDIGN